MTGTIQSTIIPFFHKYYLRQFLADVLCVDGKIAAVGSNLTVPEGAEIIDATDRLVIPGTPILTIFIFINLHPEGGIDTHTHMQLPFMGTVSVDDFNIGTQAAVAGGTTFLSKGIDPFKGRESGKIVFLF